MIAPEDELQPWSADDGIENIENLDTPVDQYSAWYRRDTIVQRDRHGYVDAYYGLAYSEQAAGISAIYGLQDELPEFSCDALSNDGFLRVPFRRVPRRIVRSKEELLQIVGGVRSADPKIAVLYRGQREEYVLRRSERAKLFLYGDAGAREPSLIPSGLRKAVALDRVLQQWCLLLRQFQGSLLKGLEAWAAEGTMEEYRRETRRFFMSPHLLLFALALAQHYGLPTSGLDVTPNIEIALFFALFDYKVIGQNRAVFLRGTNATSMPVIYLLAPSEGQTFDFDHYRPSLFPPGRPQSQEAHFIPIGWGKNKNACARRIFLALYLDPAGDFDTSCRPSDLFPKDDKFAAFLYQAGNSDLGGELAEAFKSYYLVDL